MIPYHDHTSMNDSVEAAIQKAKDLRTPLVLLAFVLAILAGTACANIAKPQGWSGPILTDGLTLVSSEGELFAISNEEEDTFHTVWVFPDSDLEVDEDIDPKGIYGTPVVVNGIVYYGAYDGNVYALDLETGRPVWSEPFNTDDRVIGGVASNGSALYVGTNSGNLFALDLDSGELVWDMPFEAEGGIWSTPLLVDDTLYVASLGDKLYAVDAATGKPSSRWEEPFDAGTGLISSPVLADGLILVSGLDRKMYAVELDTGTSAWADPFKADNWFWTRPLVVEGVVYAGSLDGNIYALELETGRPVWALPFETGAPVRSASIIHDDVLVVANRNGDVYGLEPGDGSLIWRAIELAPGRLPEESLPGKVLGHPIVMGEMVVYSNHDGDLFAVQVDEGRFSRIQITYRLGAD